MHANKNLIEIILGNLFTNAIRHNIFGGVVSITCMENSMTFTNTGRDFPLDTTKMFQRFQSKPSFEGGVGLGLHIAKKIADYNNIDLCYKFIDKQHKFILVIP